MNVLVWNTVENLLMMACGGLKVLLTGIIRTVSFSQYTFTTHCIAGERGGTEIA